MAWVATVRVGIVYLKPFCKIILLLTIHPAAEWLPGQLPVCTGLFSA